MKKWILILLATFSLEYGHAEELTLARYLSQVQASHQGYKSSTIRTEVAENKREEASLPYSFYLLGEASYLIDQSPRTSPFMQGNRSDQEAYLLGISKKTRFGLTSKLYYSLNHTVISGLPTISGVSFSMANYYTNNLNLELSQSLLKDGFGRGGRATEQYLIAQQESNQYTQMFEGVSILADAETKYWNLALAQQIVKVRRDGLTRAEEIVNYTERRLKQNLVESADLIQAQAALESRRLDYQSADNNHAEAVIAFNLARGVISQEVNETLLIPEIQTISSLPPLEKPEYRLDTLAAKRSADASIANSIASAENSKPDLQVFGKVSTGGLNQDLGTSVGNSFTTRYPITQIGLRLNIPLDRAAVESTQKAYQLEAQSAELTYARKVQEQNSLWNNLIRGFEERKKRINIAASAEKLQLEKLQNEKKIHSAGRSTTYQILMFEQDYLGTQATKLQLMQDALSIYAQLKTFGGNK